MATDRRQSERDDDSRNRKEGAGEKKGGIASVGDSASIPPDESIKYPQSVIESKEKEGDGSSQEGDRTKDS